jgi:hypothetical protein
MRIDEAYSYLTRCREASVPATVLYRPVLGDRRHTPGEEGVITRVSGDWVFVRWGAAEFAQAEDAADLEVPAEAGIHVRRFPPG